MPTPKAPRSWAKLARVCRPSRFRHPNDETLVVPCTASWAPHVNRSTPQTCAEGRSLSRPQRRRIAVKPMVFNGSHKVSTFFHWPLMVSASSTSFRWSLGATYSSQLLFGGLSPLRRPRNVFTGVFQWTFSILAPFGWRCRSVGRVAVSARPAVQAGFL